MSVNCFSGVSRMSRLLYPECPHSRDKGDRHRFCIVCLGREHAEAALSGGSTCEFCAELTLAKITKRSAYWTRREAREAAAQAEEIPTAEGSTDHDMEGHDCREPATANPAPTLPSGGSSRHEAAGELAAPAPHARVRSHHEAVELPRGFHDQPLPELVFGQESEEQPEDFSDAEGYYGEYEEEVVEESRASSPPVGSRTLGLQLHEVATRAASKLGLPLPTPPSTEMSLLDGEYYAGPQTPAPCPIPFFPEVHRELVKTWSNPYSARAPVPGFAAYMHMDQAKECGYLSFPPVEDTVASYLSPSSPALRLGRKPLLPSPVARLQATLAEKSYLAAGQAACSINTAALLQRYQAKLLTELSNTLDAESELVVELRRATDLSLRLTRCSSQAVGRAMGAAVATQRSLWLSLAQLSEREKAPLLDAPVSAEGVFGDAVGTMTAKFEVEQKSREAFMAWMPRSRGEPRGPPGGPAPAPGMKRGSGSRSPALPAKMPARRGWQRHPFRPPPQPQPQAPQPAPQQQQQRAPFVPRQTTARRGGANRTRT